MTNSIRVLTRFVKHLDGHLELEIAPLVDTLGLSIANVTEQTDIQLGEGDLVVAEVSGLSNAQLTALKARSELVALIDKDDSAVDFSDSALSKAQIQAVATAIRDKFGIPLAKIQAVIDANDATLTRNKVERLLRRLCVEIKRTK